MLTVRKVNYNWNTECNSCGKVRKTYYEIRYGIRVTDFPYQPYTTLPLCASCLKRLGNSIEKRVNNPKAGGKA